MDGETTEGFWIRQSPSPAARVGGGRLHSFIWTDNKENVAQCNGGRRSPLPEWYPRMPLRDITAIAGTLQRRRICMRATPTRRRNIGIAGAPRSALLRNPSQPEQCVAVQTQMLSSDVSNISPAIMTTASTISCLDVNLLPPSAEDAGLFPIDLNWIEAEKKLWSSIDEIERIVLKNSKEVAKEAANRANRTSTLMSMR